MNHMDETVIQYVKRIGKGQPEIDYEEVSIWPDFTPQHTLLRNLREHRYHHSGKKFDLDTEVKSAILNASEAAATYLKSQFLDQFVPSKRPPIIMIFDSVFDSAKPKDKKEKIGLENSEQDKVDKLCLSYSLGSEIYSRLNEMGEISGSEVRPWKPIIKPINGEESKGETILMHSIAAQLFAETLDKAVTPPYNAVASVLLTNVKYYPDFIAEAYGVNVDNLIKYLENKRQDFTTLYFNGKIADFEYKSFLGQLKERKI